MRTHFPRRPNTTTARQNKSDADAESNFADTVLDLIGDEKQDEVALEAAKCFQVAVGENGYMIYRANVEIQCIGCSGQIKRDTLFSARWPSRPDLYAWGACCKPICALGQRVAGGGIR